MDKMIREFQNPPISYRPEPLWVWNDEMNHEQIDMQLKELAEHGFGGAFVHPRPGMVIEYMSDAWFDAWGYALKKAKELGMQLGIYDENSYPSGFGGGLVSSQHPEALQTLARFEVHEAAEEIVEECISAFAVKEKDGKYIDAVNVLELPREEWKNYGDKILTVALERPAVSGWMAGYAYVDLMRPQVTESFLKCTHEQYYQHFGEDFGKSIPAIFTDELSVCTAEDGRLNFSYWFVYEFKKRNGYDLEKHLPCIFADVEGDSFDHPAKKVRFDYYDTIHELLTKNCVQRTSKWCEEHQVKWTGHYMEHLWPHVGEWTSPSMQSYYEYHQWPAIDMLLANYLRDTPVHALTHTIREVRSVSNQFGKERTVCELYGAGGWDSNFEDYKRMGDWVLVNGINFITQHLVYGTLMGARKHDHPQSFDWREPWWNEYTLMNDYLGRASYLLSKGKMQQRILVLNPSTTGYLTPPSEEKGTMFSDPAMDCIKEPDMTEFLSLCQKLSDLQWDYDLGDEYILERHGKVAEGKLEVAEQQYSCIVISGSMKNMLSSTVELLKTAAASGVEILTVGTPGFYVDGVWDEKTYAELKKIWKSVEQDEIDEKLEMLLGRRILTETPFPAGFEHMRRKLENGDELWFFANFAMEPYRTTLSVCGGDVKQLNLFTGEVKEIGHTSKDGWLLIPVEMVRNQSLMLYVSAKENESIAACVDKIDVSGSNLSKTALELVDITPDSENVLPVIYADYAEEKNMYVKRVCDQVFKERGFASNPWDNKVQYKTNVLDRNAEYGEDSGFTATYHFLVDKVPEKLEVVAEHPDLCHLRVNGMDVSWIPDAHWMDHHFGVADITDLTVSGENHVEIVVDVFNVLMEVDAIYLKGNFGVEIRDGKWTITEAKKMTYGSWREQGYPFYSQAVNYQYRFEMDEVPEMALLDLADYDASAISLTVNGEYAGLLHEDGRRAKDIAEYLKEGENTVTLRVCGSLKNLLGPHFVKDRGTAWPAMWKASPKYLSDAENFDLMDFGLWEAPVISYE